MSFFLDTFLFLFVSCSYWQCFGIGYGMVLLRFVFIVVFVFLYRVLSSNVYIRVFSLRYLRVCRYRFAFIVACLVLCLRVFRCLFFVNCVAFYVRLVSLPIFSLAPILFYQCVEYCALSVRIGSIFLSLFFLGCPWGGFVASPEDLPCLLARADVQQRGLRHIRMSDKALSC